MLEVINKMTCCFLSEPEPLKVTLPYPPSVNSYWKRTKRGMRRSDKATAYITAVFVTTAEARRKLPLKGLTGRLSVEIRLHMPDKRRRDIDNTAKAILDSMQYAGIYKDDNQIDRMLIIRMPELGGFVDVEIKEI